MTRSGVLEAGSPQIEAAMQYGSAAEIASIDAESGAAVNGSG